MILAAFSSAFATTDFYSSAPGTGSPDTLCDVWQAVYNAWGLLPGDDEDHDGCTNFVESVAGSDPRNPGDCIKVGNMAISSGNVVFSLDAEIGKKYTIQQCDTPTGTYTDVAGSSVVASTTSLVLSTTKPVGPLTKFYKVKVEENDADGDGVSDWAEAHLGSNPLLAENSGSGYNYADTLHSMLSLTAETTDANGYERQDKTATSPVAKPAKIGLTRTWPPVGSPVPVMALPGIVLSGAGGAPSATKANASPSDHIALGSVTVPAGAGAAGGAPYEVNITPAQDALDEVPEYLNVSFNLPGAPASLTAPSATVCLCDADPANEKNNQLYVAFLGREAGVTSTASGYATAVVNGDHTEASISLVFNNLSSAQNTAYIRLGPNNDLAPALPLGQVSGFNYNVVYKPGFLSTDQAFLSALTSGNIGCAVTTANYTNKEIFGYFQKASGSTTFDPNNPTLDEPALGSAAWQTTTEDQIERDIWRFMGQSTFGGTTALYTEIRAKVDAAISGGGTYLDGLEDWLDEQMNPSLTPSINFMKLVMAADNEEFMLRGNKPITYSADPQFNGAAYNVTYNANGEPTISTTADNNRGVNNYPQSAPNRRREWWTMVLQSKDQVRQRMTQALSEILVISENDQTVLDRHYGTANFWDMLATGAFGKYRTLLEQVTYSPMMGVYLSHISNRATYDAGAGLIVSPDENYAREIMQLFSIGLVLRHPDGSLVLDGAGLPIPTYDQTDITELARVMTGWSHGARNAISWVSQWSNTTLTWNHQSGQRVGTNVLLNGGSANSQWFGRDDGHLFFPTPWINPMKLIGRINTTVYHDFVQYIDPVTDTPVENVSKRLLAGKHGQFDVPMRAPPVATGYSNDVQWHNMAALDMTDAHNALAGNPLAAVYPEPGDVSQAAPGHTNTPINISRWLIQRLVTSNPSNGYIYRVQKAYRDSNGNLGAVMKAILLDYEARSLQLADSSISHGRVKEPLVALAATFRALRAFSGAPLSILKDNAPPFSDSDSPMTSAYSSAEYAKFSTHNNNPPSLPDGWATGPFRFRFNDLTNSIGQSPQRAPSVFNWFLPDYVKPGAMAEAGLFAPELQISTESNDVAKTNFFYNFTWSTPVGFSTQPGSDAGISDFVLSNNNATAAAAFFVNGQLTNSLTFNSSNWGDDQTITVTALNNSMLSNLSNNLLRFNVSGAGTGYDGIAQPPEAITVQDDEKPNEAILVAGSGFNTWVQEAGKTDTVNVRLSAPPPSGADVTVTAVANAAQVTFSPASLTFNSTNWKINQTFTVTAVNDTVSEAPGTANDTLVLTSSSTAANFNGLTASHAVGVVDNNDGGSSFDVLITETSGSNQVTETSNTSVSTGVVDSYTIVLTKAPTTGTVRVNIVLSNTQIAVNTTTGGTSFTTSSAFREFTTANWSTPQEVRIRGNDDTTAEGSYPANPIHAGIINHSINANVGGYVTTQPIQSLGVTVTDNDERIIIAHTDGETRVSENGALTDTFTVRLRTLPTTNVYVSLGSNTLSCNPPSLTFTPANYNVNQTVTVSASNDFLKQGLRSAWNENVVPTQAIGTVSVIGGEITGITMTNVGNGYTSQPRVTFGGSGGSGANGYALVSPDGTITGIQVVTKGSGYPSSGSTVAIDPPPYGGGLVIAAATSENSADSNYNGYWSYTHSALKASILDDDLSGLILTQTSGGTEVSEGGATDTYNLALASAPTSDVTVAISPAVSTAVPPVAQVMTDVSSVTFTSANWNTPQTVTVTAVNDATVEGNITTLINHTLQSIDKAYAGLQNQSLVAMVVDNDLLPLTITHNDGYTAVAEGGAALPTSVANGIIYLGDRFRVRLPFNPTSNVTVTLKPDSQITVSPPTLTFTSANGTTDQTVTVTAATDTALEDSPHYGILKFDLSSSDARYNNPDQVPMVIPVYDKDAPGIVIAETDLTTSITLPYGGSTRPTEGGTDTFMVKLTKQPTTNVVINLSSSNTANLTVSPSSLTFTNANWNTNQTVTVTAVNDQIIESREKVFVSLSVNDASSDNAYDPVSDQTLPIWIYNNPRRNEGLVFVETGGDGWVAEGGKTDTLMFYLTARPDVDVPVTIDSNTQLSVDKNTFIFTPDNWNVPQTVQVEGLDDLVVENNHNVNLQFRCNTAPGGTPILAGDARWTFNNPAQRFDIVDNDGIGVIIAESGGDTRTVEGGTGGANIDTHTVRLSKAPNGNVAVSVASSSTTLGHTVSPATLTFTTANWDVPQTVTVTATNDTTVEGHTTSIFNQANIHTYNVTHSINTGLTTDTTGYAALTGLQTVINFITDDDGSIITSHTGLDTRVHEDGTVTDTYEVVLRGAPTANVTVNVAVPANQGIQASPLSLIFTPSDWNTPKLVTISGADNAVNDRLHTADITHTSTSADGNFNAQTIRAIRAQIVSKDTVQVVLYETSSTTVLTEGGVIDDYYLGLSHQPTQDVVVSITTDAQQEIISGSSTLTFTSANWNVLQRVLVRAIDDLDMEVTPHNGFIAHTVTSSDSRYSGLTIAGIPTFITDNEIPSVRVIPSGGSTILSEAGQTDTYQVYLSQQPSVDVTVTINPGSQASVVSPGATLTFTNSNWNLPQTVTLAAVNDVAVEGNHTTTVTHTVSSSSFVYDMVGVPSISASITDNDGPQLVINHTGGSTTVTEGNTSDTFTIRLSQLPAGSNNVTVTLVPPTYIIPVPPYAKQFGYYTSDLNASNQNRERVVMDFAETILLYRDAFYNHLETVYGTGAIPVTPADVHVQNAHWAANKALIDKLDIWWCGGSLKARYPVLIEPNQALPSPLPAINPRQVIMDCLYMMNGGNNNLGTTRYEPEIVFNPKAPPNTTFANEIRDRIRWATYLMSTTMPSFVSH